MPPRLGSRMVASGLVAVGFAVLGAGCASSTDTVEATDVSGSAAAMLLSRTAPPPPDDRIEVWVCRVPIDSPSPWYSNNGWRLSADSEAIAAEIQPVSGYFANVSQGRYSPLIVAGGEVAADTGGPDQCADRALAASGPNATAVLVVADAEHAADHPGGWGRPGNGCAAGCSARQSRRAVVVGAADFHPDWKGNPPLDLIQHELGHSLGWGHSTVAPGVAATGIGPVIDASLPVGDSAEHANPFDLMSDSAALRRRDSEERDAPPPLAVHRLVAGWLGTGYPAGEGRVEVWRGETPVKVALTPADVILVERAGALWSIELVESTMGDDGLIVHRIDPSTTPATVTLVAGVVAESWSAETWTMKVDAADGRATIDLSPV